jgi:hypothetical protein
MLHTNPAILRPQRTRAVNRFTPTAQMRSTHTAQQARSQHNITPLLRPRAIPGGPGDLSSLKKTRPSRRRSVR